MSCCDHDHVQCGSLPCGCCEEAVPWDGDSEDRIVIPVSDLRRCEDQNGCGAWYPARCRNAFWPDFCHPRWLCCRDLYCGSKGTCVIPR